MATIAALAVTGAGIWSASASSKANSKTLKGMEREAERVREQNRIITEDTYGRQKKLVEGIPGLEELLPQGGKIAREQSDYLFDFVMGDTKDNFREAQSINSDLASFNFGSIGTNITNILRSQQFDLVGMTGGDPVGSLSNLSAQNVFNFSQQGLSNYLALNDHFAKTAQTDRFNPYNIATDLYKVEEARANQFIGLEEGRANRLIGGNNQWYASFADIAGAKIANKSAEYAGYNAAIANGISTYTGMSSAKTSKTTADSQAGFYKSFGSQQGMGAMSAA